MKVQVELEVNEEAWLDTMTPELWGELKSGKWRILAVGFDMKHGLGSFMIRKDNAPQGEDHFQGLQRMAKGIEEQFKLITKRAIESGQL